MATSATVAYYFLTLVFYGFFLSTTPLLFLSACFGHLNPKEFYGNIGMLMMVAVIGDVTFILFTNVLLSMIYDKLSQCLTQNNVLVTICMDSVLTFVLGGEDDLDTTKMAVICISLYVICSIKLVCGSVDRTRVTHILFKVFLFITIQHALNKNLNGFLSCGIVTLATGIVEVTPSLEPWNVAVLIPEMAISTVAYFLTSSFYGLLLGTAPLLFLSACFGHLNPKEFYGNIGMLMMIAIIGDVTFILFTNILLSMIYDKLSQYLTQNKFSRFKVLVIICMDFVLTFVLGGKGDLDTTKMAAICISLYAICSIKLVCGIVDRSRVTHILFKVFLFITIQHALNQNLNGFLSCGIVVLTAGIVEITPSLDPWNAAVTPEMAGAHEAVTFGGIRRAIPLLG